MTSEESESDAKDLYRQETSLRNRNSPMSKSRITQNLNQFSQQHEFRRKQNNIQFKMILLILLGLVVGIFGYVRYLESPLKTIYNDKDFSRDLYQLAKGYPVKEDELLKIQSGKLYLSTLIRLGAGIRFGQVVNMLMYFVDRLLC